MLCQPATGFYIPAYQRDYAWGKDKVQRLIADSLHGLQLLVEKDDAITFIGTLIVLHDVKYQTVNPVIRADLPSKVLLVIDGQQRLTTLALLNTVLHEELSRRVKDKEFQNGVRPAFAWLRDKTKEVLAQLALTYRLDMVHGEEGYQHYPRLVRGLVDTWSRKGAQAVYRSPVAACLYAYLLFADAGGGRKFEYQPPEGVPEDEKTGHEMLAKNRETLRKEVGAIADGSDGDDESEFPPLKALATNTGFHERLLKAPLSPEVVAQLCGGEGTDKERQKFDALLRLVLFSKFVMDRVAVTVVTAKNEDYAFDMFEALNTTGEPLTAFETFKPKVIEEEGLAEYAASPSHAFLKTVEAYIGQSLKPKDRHDSTTTLLLPFALAETGKKLAKRLTDQRTYLRGGFDDLPDKPAKRDFVQHLAHTADFLRHLWPDEREPELDGGEFPSELTLLCLDAPRAANHHIPVGLLSRFYALYRAADAAGKAAARAELAGAVQAVTAFFVLWRGSRRTTANIDTHYRRILSDGIELAGVRAFARRPEKGKEAEVPTAAQLRTAFRHVLEHDGKEGLRIATRQDWVDRVVQVDVYKQSRELAKLLLYFVTHDTAPDPNSRGLVSKARPDSLNMLTLARWRDDLTVEHIAPQSRNTVGWEKALYDDADLVNTLGNLALSPLPENASLGKRAWAAKRVMYQVLGTPSLDALSARLAAAKLGGIEFASSTEKILEKAAYLPHLAAIAEVQGEWTADLVKKRSARLAELAWDRIAPWLGLT